MSKYIEIKKELLKNEAISDVKVNENKKTIRIIPRQDLSFYTIEEPIEEYIKTEDEETIITINGTDFNIKNADYYNTNIYEIIIKEI